MTIDAHKAPVLAVQARPTNGRMQLASAAYDGTVKLWMATA
jgi:hypothetical protein